MESKPDIQKTVRRMIFVLLALLILAGAALAARLIWLQATAQHSDTAIVPDNLIGETGPSLQRTQMVSLSRRVAAPIRAYAAPRDAVSVELYQGQPSDNEQFRVQNMFPGDQITQYFALTVSHSREVEIFFTVEVMEQTKALGDALQICITHMESGTVIYSGPVNAMTIDGYGKTFPQSENGETVIYYQVDISLPTSAGNEYQNAMLLADMRWFVKDAGPLEPPVDTGDTILIFVLAALVALAMLIVLLYLRRRGKEAEDAKEA